MRKYLPLIVASMFLLSGCSTLNQERTVPRTTPKVSELSEFAYHIDSQFKYSGEKHGTGRSS